MARTDAHYFIEKLRLEPHPEGGFYRQTYKADLTIAPVGQLSHPVASKSEAPRVEQPDARAASTAIYFLLEGENFSAFHRLKSDEMWHFYAGSPMIVHVIDPAGEYSSILLGGDLDAGQVLQAVVKAGCWFASEIARPQFSETRREAGHPNFSDPKFSLVGCTVAPGFEFEDFEMGKRDELVRKYPQHRLLVERLTR